MDNVIAVSNDVFQTFKAILFILDQELSQKKLVLHRVLDYALFTLIRNNGQGHRCGIYINIVSKQKYVVK